MIKSVESKYMGDFAKQRIKIVKAKFQKMKEINWLKINLSIN